MVFVNSMSHLWYPEFSDDDLDLGFAVMMICGLLGRGHVFQCLTKEPARMLAYFSRPDIAGRWVRAALKILRNHPRLWYQADGLAAGISDHVDQHGPRAPWLWLGTSTEDQKRLEEREADLLRTPAFVHFLSYEPALTEAKPGFQLWRCACGWSGMPRDMLAGPGGNCCPSCGGSGGLDTSPYERLNWVIAGSESGAGARPSEVSWFRSIRDQCGVAGAAFFFKQWTGKLSTCGAGDCGAITAVYGTPERKPRLYTHGGTLSLPFLDGRQHKEFPCDTPSPWPYRPRSPSPPAGKKRTRGRTPGPASRRTESRARTPASTSTPAPASPTREKRARTPARTRVSK
jgi:protein gp37